MNEKKERINKTSFFRENALKFLASRYSRKGERCLATAGWHSWATLPYHILFYSILSLSDLFEPILYQQFYFFHIKENSHFGIYTFPNFTTYPTLTCCSCCCWTHLANTRMG